MHRGERSRAGAQHDRTRQRLVDDPQPPPKQRGGHAECAHAHGDRRQPRTGTRAVVHERQRDTDAISITTAGEQTGGAHADLLPHDGTCAATADSTRHQAAASGSRPVSTLLRAAHSPGAAPAPRSCRRGRRAGVPATGRPPRRRGRQPRVERPRPDTRRRARQRRPPRRTGDDRRGTARRTAPRARRAARPPATRARPADWRSRLRSMIASSATARGPTTAMASSTRQRLFSGVRAMQQHGHAGCASRDDRQVDRSATGNGSRSGRTSKRDDAGDDRQHRRRPYRKCRDRLTL